MIRAEAKDFSELVGFRPLAFDVNAEGLAAARQAETHGTTVLALRYAQGVLLLADRRATVGNLIMYDQAEKIAPLDDETVIAISGAFARSVEVCRFLKHSFKYYNRMYMNEMSTEGKLMEISRALASNMQLAMQGIGMFLPIVAAYDKKRDEFGIYFFDAAGARFENADYACAGSGSERIRGLFEYLIRSKGAWHERKLDDVLLDGLHMLDIAAELDSATGGFNKNPPIVRILDRDGNRDLPEKQLRAAIGKVLKS
jgi:proteasome beta subunit